VPTFYFKWLFGLLPFFENNKKYGKEEKLINNNLFFYPGIET
jgi:hypothetical protein